MSIGQKQFEVGVFQRLSYKLKMWLLCVAFHYDDFHITVSHSSMNTWLETNGALLYKSANSNHHNLPIFSYLVKYFQEEFLPW